MSNADVSYESELFPAALFNKWKPAHVAVFYNGNVIITGVTSMSLVNRIIYDVENYLLSVTSSHPNPK